MSEVELFLDEGVWNCSQDNEEDDLPVHFFVLGKHEVVAGEGYAEDYGGDALEAVDPLLSLWPLAAHVKHPERWRVRKITIIFSGYDPSISYLQGLKL